MTDLELTRLCAESMGLDVVEVGNNKPEHTLRINGLFGDSSYGNYDPLHDDSQAMALVKRLALNCTLWSDGMSDGWLVQSFLHQEFEASNINLNRAIVEVCSKMQLSKGSIA